VAARVRELLSEYAERQPGGHAPAAAPHPVVPMPLAPWWRRLSARVPMRLDPGRRAAAAVGLAVLVAAVLTGLWLLAQRPHPVALSAGASQLPGAAPSAGGLSLVAPHAVGAAPAPAPAPSPVVVDVAGRVRRPGLYRLPAGSRVDDAVRAAGGPLAGVDLSSLNLAARLVDGQQILVGAAGGVGPAGQPGPDPGGGLSGGPAAPVELNSATLDQLETLPGVGPVLGQHILDWREQHGQFTSVDQLQDVSGIGPAKFAALAGLVTV
jgi:competence protein ComEA